MWVPDVGAETVYKVDPQAIPSSAHSPYSYSAAKALVWLITADDHDKMLVRYKAATGVEGPELRGGKQMCLPMAQPGPRGV